jgi:hypothetical protein
MKIIVYHSFYGCATGCCGHFVQLENGRELFKFAHPDSNDPENIKKFAEDMIRWTYGEEHVKDLDCENCHIKDDE